MNIKRAILSGALIWLLIFSLFTVLYFIPVVKDSELMQGLISVFFLFFFSILGSAFYYRKAGKTKAFPLSLVMASTALVLDALVTVPFVEIPYNGRGHLEFFTNPLLWLLVIENILIINLFARLKIKTA